MNRRGGEHRLGGGHILAGRSVRGLLGNPAQVKARIGVSEGDDAGVTIDIATGGGNRGASARFCPTAARCSPGRARPTGGAKPQAGQWTPSGSCDSLFRLK